MNYHDLVPYVKRIDDIILEVDINFLFDGKADFDKKITDYVVIKINDNLDMFMYSSSHNKSNIKPRKFWAFLLLSKQIFIIF